MQITLNGERREAPQGQSVLDLVAALSLPPKAVVVELNGTIVDQAQFAATRLSPGDVLEVVRFVGGG